MKYIRTKDGRLINRSDFQSFKTHGTTGRYLVRTLEDDNDLELWLKYNRTNVIKQSNTIEELCDWFVYDFVGDDLKIYHDQCIYNKYLNQWEGIHGLFTLNETQVKTIKGAIWTDKGLIYVANLNDKGELELL